MINKVPDRIIGPFIPQPDLGKYKNLKRIPTKKPLPINKKLIPVKPFPQQPISPIAPRDPIIKPQLGYKYMGTSDGKMIKR
jgi:hypothetical protein